MIITSYFDGPNPSDAEMFNNEIGAMPFLSLFDTYTIGNGFLRFANTADGSFMKVSGDFAMSDHAEASLKEFDTAAGTLWIGSGKISRIVYSTTENGGKLQDVDVSAIKLLAASNDQDVGALDALLTGRADVFTLTGAENLCYGNGGADRISVSSGRSGAIGGLGDDLIRVTPAISGATFERRQQNWLDGNGGDDLIIGWRQHDVIMGNIGDDTLRGGGGRDILRGSLGDDRLNGGAGNDVLNGAEGSDVFWFGKNSGQDAIWHFHSGGPEQDRIAGAKIVAVVKDGADTIVSFEGVNQVTLYNVKPSELDYLL